MRRFLLYPIVVSLLLFVRAIAQAPPTRIQGTVVDTSGAELPGVTLYLRCSQALVPEISTLTDARGAYVFRDVTPGECSIEVALAGFQSAQWTGVVESGITKRLLFTLKVGALEETITITAGSPAVQAQSSVMARSVNPEFNTEGYDTIDENRWTAVRQKPLSTFSTDVDTASYSNVRRFLNDGELPPKDAVRIEELINYFSYDYSAPPQNGAPVAITTAFGDAPWNSRHKLALIGLQARRLDLSKMPPRNLVFLIDVSGSMEDANKLPLVKQSLTMLARNLAPQDRVAIVVYAGAAGLVLPSTVGSDTTAIVGAIGRLEAGGSTNGAEGIELAYEIARQHFIEKGVNRVVLATDGDFNVGVTNQGDLVRLIEEEREHGISLSVLGFGMGNLKDDTLEKLADRGNGNYAYIDTLAEARKVLIDNSQGTLVTVAKDVKLQVEFNPRVVSAYRLIGYENRLLEDQDFNDDLKDAGDMGAGHSVTALYELIPAGEKSDVPEVSPLKYQRGTLRSTGNAHEALTVTIRYKAPDARKSTQMSAVVRNEATNTEALGFPAAVASFGMLLRDSEFRGSATWQSTRALAEKFRGEDRFEHRAEFIRLIGTAEALSDPTAASRQQ
jgi:Ca-activated chloride channel homolog